jgi:hypothetical protein
MKFAVIKAVVDYIEVLCSPVGGYQHFGGTCCLHLQ